MGQNWVESGALFLPNSPCVILVCFFFILEVSLPSGSTNSSKDWRAAGPSRLSHSGLECANSLSFFPTFPRSLWHARTTRNITLNVVLMGLFVTTSAERTWFSFNSVSGAVLSVWPFLVMWVSWRGASGTSAEALCVAIVLETNFPVTRGCCVLFCCCHAIVESNNIYFVSSNLCVSGASSSSS